MSGSWSFSVSASNRIIGREPARRTATRASTSARGSAASFPVVRNIPEGIPETGGQLHLSITRGGASHDLALAHECHLLVGNGRAVVRHLWHTPGALE